MPDYPSCYPYQDTSCLTTDGFAAVDTVTGDLKVTCGGGGWQPSVIVIGGGNTLLDGLGDPIGPGIIKASALLVAADFHATPSGYLNPGARSGVGTVTRSSGVITAVAAPSLSFAGWAYKPFADMTVAERTCTVTGGGGTGAIVRISSVDSSGRVTGFSVVAGGTDYASTPTITVPPPTGDPTFGADWPDGVGWGDIYSSAGAWSQRALLRHDPSGPLPWAFVKGQRCVIYGTDSLSGARGSVTFRVGLYQ